MKFFATILLIVLSSSGLLAQDDLMALMEKEAKPEATFTESTFKGTRLINGHSVETRKKGVLDVIISHRFGRLNSGGYEFFGLDDSNVRLGLDYGVTNRLNVGIGRNSFEKTYDGFLKYKVLQQSAQKGVPVSVVGFASVALKTLKTGNPEGEPSANSRLAYCYQALIARKFSTAFSFQLAPTFVHRNSLLLDMDETDVAAIGAGGRLKLTRRVSLNAEYFYQLNAGANPDIHNSFSIGFDIETGGHVFQLHLTNSRAMIEKGFITETYGDFFDGDIHFGFNISRVFQLSE